jgi:hypothetical protein
MISQTQTAIDENGPNRFMLNEVTDMNFAWTVECLFQVEGLVSANNRSITVSVSPTDTTPPNVTLITPSGENITNNTVTFNYTAYDSGTIQNCSLYTNTSGSWTSVSSEPTAWSSRTTNANVTNGWLNNFTLQDITPGTYTWNVVCLDSAGNPGSDTQNKTFTVTGTNLQIPLTHGYNLISIPTANTIKQNGKGILVATIAAAILLTLRKRRK